MWQTWLYHISAEDMSSDRLDFNIYQLRTCHVTDLTLSYISWGHVMWQTWLYHISAEDMSSDRLDFIIYQLRTCHVTDLTLSYISWGHVMWQTWLYHISAEDMSCDRLDFIIYQLTLSYTCQVTDLTIIYQHKNNNFRDWQFDQLLHSSSSGDDEMTDKVKCSNTSSLTSSPPEEDWSKLVEMSVSMIGEKSKFHKKGSKTVHSHYRLPATCHYVSSQSLLPPSHRPLCKYSSPQRSHRTWWLYWPPNRSQTSWDAPSAKEEEI